MGFRIYNTLTRRLEEFTPLEPGRVGVYVCGPTVYGHAHLGHAKSYVSFDVLVRYLRYLGNQVTYVQNITDVGHLTDDADEGEDKIDRQARREHKHPMAIAEYYTRSYFEDMDALACVRPDISPRASGHIPEQIELVQTLLDKGFAYEVNGSVYFDVMRFAEYGKLSGRSLDDMQAGARVEVNPEKRHPADFALWKRAEPNHIMQWNSPWGRGYPGWHLECSVMSMKYLGATIDIHGGGIENQFPHHECEIAQSEAANGVPFVRYWVHNNMVTVDGQKMGKSLNNFITLKQLFREGHPLLSRTYDPLAVRQLILQSHYRSPIDFSDAALAAAQSGYDRICEAVLAVRNEMQKATDRAVDNTEQLYKDVHRQCVLCRKKFKEAMDDDLNTSVALSRVFKLVKLSHSLLANERSRCMMTPDLWQVIDDSFTDLGGKVLGIVRDTYPESSRGDDALLDHLLQLMIQQRADARQRKDFATADAIRDQLASFGIVLEDKPGGLTTWRRA